MRFGMMTILYRAVRLTTKDDEMKKTTVKKKAAVKKTNETEKNILAAIASLSRVNKATLVQRKLINRAVKILEATVK